MNLRLTYKSYDYLLKKIDFDYFLTGPIYKLKKNNDDTFYYIEYEDDTRTVSFLLEIAEQLYTNLPDEKNVWVDNQSEYNLNDPDALRIILLPFENTSTLEYPLSGNRLSKTIKDNGIDTLEKAKSLSKNEVFSILPFGGSDLVLLPFQIGYEGQTDDTITFDHTTLAINNRHISMNFEFTGGTISFENCIIEGGITVSNADSLVLSQCIILGKVWITGTDRVYLNYSNIEQVLMYNCGLERLNIEYSKIYRFVFHSSSIERISLFKNLFIEPYIASVHFPQGTKLDMNQFVAKNINHKTIERIKKNKSLSIKDKDSFFLTYTFDQPDKPVPPEYISYDMADIFLKYGDLNSNHDLYANLIYELAYNSNHGWRKILVAVTGAFYKPVIWGLYLLLNTLLFALLYSFVPGLYFTNTLTQSKETINIWVSLYYSICQIIGTNPTIYAPTGITQIFTTIQTLANTAFLANLAVSFVKKYFRNDL